MYTVYKYMGISYVGKSHYYVLKSNAKTILTKNIIRGPQMSNLKNILLGENF